jgi:LPXTG-motif cell wall-anchored protein
VPKRMPFLILVAVLVATFFTTASVAPAGAQYCPGSDPRCPSVTGNGTGFGVDAQVDLVGHGFLPGTQVDFTISDCGSTVLLGTVTADANFEAHFSFKVPAGCCPGMHDVTLTGTGADSKPLVLTYQITVAGTSCTSSTTVAGNLPRTGGDPGTSIALGVGLVILGGVLVVIARRRTLSRRRGFAG